MPLDPQVAALLERTRQARYPDYWQLTPAQARAAHERAARVLDVAPAPVQRVAARIVPAPSADVPVRLYVPRPSAAPLPVLVWLHGGGHVVGSLDGYDALCRQLALQSDCIVVGVGYRLAPEHPFPAGVVDSFAALQWTAMHATSFGGDPGRIAVGGDSAGGNLAAVCAILARDAGAPALAFQLLAYPRTAHAEDAPSHAAFGDGFLLTRATILWFHAHYRSRDDDRYDWRYAPLLCADLARLPPALVVVGEFDALRDEGIAYAARLRDAGVPVRLHDCRGMVHGFFSLGGVAAAARAALSEAAHALRAALAGPG
ncbi:MAG: alpha/beta hydrolase [Betaproteobacteria bacterium]|nr:alpha/beta hydrolase [Betaproteobacteria bacterium]